MSKPSEPSHAAMKAAIALFGPPDETFSPEWLAGRARKIDQATGLPALEEALRGLLGRHDMRGHACPDCAEARAALALAGGADE